MKTQQLYILWDEQDGHKTDRLYLDKQSAEIALHEHYTLHWVEYKKAKIEEIQAISYLDNLSKEK